MRSRHATLSPNLSLSHVIRSFFVRAVFLSSVTLRSPSDTLTFIVVLGRREAIAISVIDGKDANML